MQTKQKEGTGSKNTHEHQQKYAQTETDTNTCKKRNINIIKHKKIYIKQIQYKEITFDCLFTINKIYKTHSEINISVNK